MNNINAAAVTTTPLELWLRDVDVTAMTDTKIKFTDWAVSPSFDSAVSTTPPSLSSAVSTTHPSLGSAMSTTHPSLGSAVSTTPPSLGSAVSTTHLSLCSAVSTTHPSLGSAVSTTHPSLGSAVSTTPPSLGSAVSRILLSMTQQVLQRFETRISRRIRCNLWNFFICESVGQWGMLSEKQSSKISRDCPFKLGIERASASTLKLKTKTIWNVTKRLKS